jgi:hypothetical protein
VSSRGPNCTTFGEIAASVAEFVEPCHHRFVVRDIHHSTVRYVVADHSINGMCGCRRGRQVSRPYLAGAAMAFSSIPGVGYRIDVTDGDGVSHGSPGRRRA